MSMANKLSIAVFVANVISLGLFLWRFIPIETVFVLGIIGCAIGLFSLFKNSKRKSIGFVLNLVLMLVLVFWRYVPPYLFSN